MTYHNNHVILSDTCTPFGPGAQRGETAALCTVPRPHGVVFGAVQVSEESPENEAMHCNLRFFGASRLRMTYKG